MLDREMRKFSRIKFKLLKDETKMGKFVLIKGNKLFNCYETRRDAKDAAYNKFQLKPPFLVRQILESEPVLVMGG